MVTVRSGTLDDAAQIEAVVRRSAIQAYSDIFPPEAPMPGVREALEEWRYTLSTDDSEIETRQTFVAEEDEVIRGVTVAIICTSDPTSGHLHRLYVDPLAWSRGIGSLLYRAAISHLLANGCTRATLWTLEKNTRARKWYERQGWELTGERIPVYAEGDVYDLVYAVDLRDIRLLPLCPT